MRIKLPGKFKRSVLAVAIVSASANLYAQTSVAPDPVSVSRDRAHDMLYQQSKYWENRGRGDLAKAALLRIMESDPFEAPALYKAGLILVSEGDLRSAKTFSNRLLRLGTHPDLAQQLAKEIANADVDRVILEQARGYAVSGKLQEASAKYEELFQNRPVGGVLAVEYFETIAGIEENWDAAVQGLREQSRLQPDNHRVLLALSNVLSYREDSRREAIANFRMLLGDPSLKERALDGLGNALLWLNATRDDRDLYELYLSMKDNEEVADKLDNLLSPKASEAFAFARIDAFGLLNQGKLAEATTAFEDLLKKKPDDAESLGGMGLVNLRRGRLNDAQSYLLKAIRSNPEVASQFQKAFNEANFWSGHKAALAALNKADYKRAAELAERLRGRNADQKSQALALRARIQAQMANWGEAERLSRQALKVNPNSPGATVDLLNALMAQNRSADMESHLLRLDSNIRANAAFRTDSVISTAERARAQLAVQAGQANKALAAYEKALAHNAKDHWLRLEFARFLLDHNRDRDAAAVMTVIQQPVSSTDALHALALYEAEQEDWGQVVALIEGANPTLMTPAVQNVAHTALLKRRIEMARQRAAVGDATTAVKNVIALQDFQTSLPFKTSIVADGLISLGKADQAAVMIKRELSKGRNLPVEVSMEYARQLVQLGEVTAAHRLLGELSLRKAELNGAHIRQLESTYDEVLLQASRNAMQDGNLQVALGYLRGLYENDPLNPQVLRSLGEIAQRKGDYVNSLRFYESAMDVDPEDRYALHGAVGAALDAEDYDTVSRLLDDALSRYPSDPEVYTLISKAAHSAGELDMAIEAMDTARQLQTENVETPMERNLREENQFNPRGLPGVDVPALPRGNPFRSGGVDVSADEASTEALAWHHDWKMVPVSNKYEAETTKPVFDNLMFDDADLDELLAEEIAATSAEIARQKVADAERGQFVPVNFGSGSGVKVSQNTMLNLLNMLVSQGDHEQIVEVAAALAASGSVEGDKLEEIERLHLDSALLLAEQALADSRYDLAMQYMQPVAQYPSAQINTRFLRAMISYSAAMENWSDVAGMATHVLASAPADDVVRKHAINANLQTGDVERAEELAKGGLKSGEDAKSYHFALGRIAKAGGDLDLAMDHFAQAKQAGSRNPQTADARVVRAVEGELMPQRVSAQSKRAATGERRINLPAFPEYADTPRAPAVATTQDAYQEREWRARVYGNGQVASNDRRSVRPAVDRGGDAGWSRPNSNRLETEVPRSRAQRNEDFWSAAPRSIEQVRPEYEGEEGRLRSRLRSLGQERSGRDYQEFGLIEDPQLTGYENELRDLRAEVSPYFGQSLGFRYRTGERGLSTFTEMSTPFEFNFHPGAGRLGVVLEPVFASAGDLSTDPGTLRRLGTLALVDAEDREPLNSTDDSLGGVAAEVFYDVGGFRVSVGSSPLGFNQTNLLGSISYDAQFDGGFSIGAGLVRDAVKESLLSYAGLEDPLTGETWGGVVDNRGEFRISHAFDKFAIYANGFVGLKTGLNVEDNSHFGGSVGFSIPFINNAQRYLSAGLNATYMGHDQNLRFFTFGHGGYFSPQTFFSANIPVEYRFDGERLKLRLGVAAGVQHFSEDDALFYPMQGALQSDLFALAFDEGLEAFHRGESETQFSFNAGADVRYALTRRLELQGQIRIDRAAQWTETSGMLTLRYRPGF